MKPNLIVTFQSATNGEPWQEIATGKYQFVDGEYRRVSLPKFLPDQVLNDFEQKLPGLQHSTWDYNGISHVDAVGNSRYQALITPE